jgi:hypothetical protein
MSSTWCDRWASFALANFDDVSARGAATALRARECLRYDGRPSFLANVERIVAMHRSWLLNVLAVLAVIALSSSPALAGGGPEKVFAGQIMMSEKPYPSSAKSAAAYTAAIRKQSKKAFAEDKEKEQWRIHFAAFLKAPLPDLEISVKLFEVAGKSQTLLTSFEQFTDERGQKTIISKLVLDKKQVGVNKELLMVMDYRGKVLASGRFKIVGQGDKATGKVDFNDDSDE